MNGEHVVALSGLNRTPGGALHLFGQPQPRLRQCQPKGFVLFVVRSLRHRNTFFRALKMIPSCPHRTIPD